MIVTPEWPILKLAADGRAKIVGLTVDPYDSMVCDGILAQDPRTELIAGLIVQKDRSHVGEDSRTVGAEHAYVVGRLITFASEVARAGAVLRIQQPIVIPPSHEPEPDGVIASLRADDYLSGHPRAADMLCAIEVADSSLEYDRGTKLRVYALAAVAQYVIINLPERQLEVHSSPDIARQVYARLDVLRSGQTLVVKIDGRTSIEMPVDALLPPG